MIRILIIIIGISTTLYAQDDLLDLIDDGFENTYPVNATFKAKRIVIVNLLKCLNPEY